MREKFDVQSICPYTGLSLVLGVNASLDHIIARSVGGSDDLNNLQWVYGSTDFDVNIMKGSSTEADFLKAISLIHHNHQGEKSC